MSWFKVQPAQGKQAQAAVSLSSSSSSSSSAPQKAVEKEDKKVIIEANDLCTDAEPNQLSKIPPKLHDPQTVAVLRNMLMQQHSKRGGKPSKINGIMHKTVVMPIMTGTIVFATNASGVMNATVGYAAFTGAPDYTAVAGLFEVVRVRKAVVCYLPITPHQYAVTTPIIPKHVPMMLSWDPETNTSVAFATLFGSRLLSDQRNKFCTTGEVVRKTWTIEEKVLGSASGALAPTMGNWFAVGTTTVEGAMQYASLTDAINISVAYGVATVEFEAEFGFRT